jgi:hypothetical protein
VSRNETTSCASRWPEFAICINSARFAIWSTEFCPYGFCHDPKTPVFRARLPHVAADVIALRHPSEGITKGRLSWH